MIPILIGAEEAFNAVQSQTDPVTGEGTRVALVDVRTRAEYFWVGAACQVDEIITTKEESLYPDDGKVILTKNGRQVRFEINGRHKMLQTKKITNIIISPIAINIPYKLWVEEDASLTLNSSFGGEVNALSDNYDILIFFCRSGGRSQDCLGGFDVNLFDTIYEIDQPDDKSGRGGFEGTSYSNVYNGYRGFPNRLTETQEHPSVSWKDAGLPIKTSINPLSD
ncbi:MAG: hypothetical protein GY699_01225 [Desulfobacteraceae bacterium]|nr:hypothetical protein [Desulfobacteraceae bacterium]